MALTRGQHAAGRIDGALGPVVAVALHQEGSALFAYSAR
jgi:hypothetical protein